MRWTAIQPTASAILLLHERSSVRKRPDPSEVRQLRGELTQDDCADMVGVSLRQWQRYEAEGGMPYGYWELFQIKRGVHPLYTERKRSKE